MFAEVEVIEQELLQVDWTLVAYFKPDCRSITTCLELAFERMHEVADFFFVKIKIAVARYTELVTAADVQAREQITHMHSNNG